MAQVLVERPRRGSRRRVERGKQREAARLRPESVPLRGPMGRGRGTKSLNENLAPLVRFLGSRVGRPWDAVHAEICARLRVTSAVQKHVRDHLADFVSTTTWIEDGEVVAQGRWGRPVSVEGSGARRFYVCPRSGLLRERRRGARRERPLREAPDPDVRWAAPLRQLRRIDGVWYALELAPIPEPPERLAGLRDVFLKRPLFEILHQGRDALVRCYGRGDVHAAAKRQLSKRELRLFLLPRGGERS